MVNLADPYSIRLAGASPLLPAMGTPGKGETLGRGVFRAPTSEMVISKDPAVATTKRHFHRRKIRPPPEKHDSATISLRHWCKTARRNRETDVEPRAMRGTAKRLGAQHSETHRLIGGAINPVLELQRHPLRRGRTKIVNAAGDLKLASNT